METETKPKVLLCHGDNLNVLKDIPNSYVDLIYIDPPFNTGKTQKRKRFHTENGEKIEDESFGYSDAYNDFISFIQPRLIEAFRILKSTGSFFYHIDYREVHYSKVLLDMIFGRRCFMNEIIWAYDYGGRSKTKWSCKHDNILWYVKDPEHYTFNYYEIDRIPYMAPGLQKDKDRAERGKTPTDVWWHTIVPTNGKEKTGYATQKPRGIIDRIVKVHSNPNDICLDFFAGSGTFGESALTFGRNCILVDSNIDAINVMKTRLDKLDVEWMKKPMWL